MLAQQHLPTEASPLPLAVNFLFSYPLSTEIKVCTIMPGMTKCFNVPFPTEWPLVCLHLLWRPVPGIGEVGKGDQKEPIFLDPAYRLASSSRHRY